MPADQKATQNSQSRGIFRQDISKIELTWKRHPRCIVKLGHMRSVLRTTKSALVLFVAGFALLAANRATGQTGGTSGSGTGGTTGTKLSASSFTVLFNGYSNGNWVQMNTTTQQYYFNQARCLCGTDPNGEFEIIVEPASGAGSTIQTALQNNLAGGQGVAYLFASTSTYDCLSPTSYSGGLAQFCTNLIAPGSGYPGTRFTTMSAFGNVNYVTSPPIPVAYLFNSLSTPTCGSAGTCDSTALCSTTATQTNIQFWAQTNSGSAPDFDPGPTATVSLVGYVPVPPTNVVANGGNEALQVSWDWGGDNIATDTTLTGVQLFCQRGADTQVFPTGSFGAAYQTPATVCPNNAAAVAAGSNAGGPFSNLDPKYLCSGLIPATTTSHRITGLQNGIWYSVGVAAVDRYGNISTIASVVSGKPVPTVDFYSEYKKLGGSAQGTFCAVASRHSRQSAALAICMVGLALLLVVRWRSRRGPLGPFVVVLATGTLLAGQARAQPVFHDSAFEEDRVSEAWGGSPRQYAIEARFSLYTPNIDSEFSRTTPNAAVFGSKRRPMWQLEYDWEFLQKFGTLALGGVMGYYKENALACQLTGLQSDGTCPVVANDPSSGPSGDNTGLRLIPLAALLVYRMDEAANRWHIPIVPYAKIGLNYTIWTITNGNGDVAWFTDSKGHASKGQGGTMGWQAAVGLSLSLDFIDPGAARGFDADSGVNHTYAFFELDHIDGSGLYRKDVLRVGDDTWFAGLMFEC